jgi:hypothetical protein
MANIFLLCIVLTAAMTIAGDRAYRAPVQGRFRHRTGIEASGAQVFARLARRPRGATLQRS